MAALMDPLAFNTNAHGKNLRYLCLVCGSHSPDNYVDLMITTRTNHSDLSIINKVHSILINSWVSSDDELILCIPCFHLVDQFDLLEVQLEAIRKDLTDKYVSRIGVSNKVQAQELQSVQKVHADAKKKRRPCSKKKKQSYDEDVNNYIPPDNPMLNQHMEQHSLNVNTNVPEMHAMSSGLVWTTHDSVQLQSLGDMTVTNNEWKKNENLHTVPTEPHTRSQVECPSHVPQTIYDSDYNFFNTGERLRIGTEVIQDNIVSFACIYCNQTASNVESLKSHVHMQHLPKILTASIPVELGLGSSMNCGVQLENVNKPVVDTVKQFACIFCDASFKFKSNLNLHFKEKHTPHKPFSCVECLECFRRSMELSRHKVYYCPYRKKNLSRKDKKSK